jgi:hypothetical protein
MRNRLARLVLHNWPIKLAAVALALLLYARVQTQRILTEEFTVGLEVRLPPNRQLAAPLPPVHVRVAGRGSVLLSLRSLPTIISRQVPDTLTGSDWVLQLHPADVRLPSELNVTVVDVMPREIAVALNPVAVKRVRVVARVRLAPESGLALSTAPEVAPPQVRLIGAEDALAGVESVTTLPLVVRGAPGPFFQAATIDTTLLGDVRVVPAQVSVSGEIGTLLERSFSGVPVESGAGDLSGLTVVPARVLVVVSGPATRVAALTRDSVHVVAHLAGGADTAAAYARLTVLTPPGVTARVSPDSVLLRRRGGAE